MEYDPAPHWYDELTDPRYERSRELRAECAALQDDLGNCEAEKEDMIDDFGTVVRALDEIARVQTDYVDIKQEIDVDIAGQTFAVSIEAEACLQDVAERLEVTHAFHEAHDTAGKW